MSRFSLVLPSADPQEPVVSAAEALGGTFVTALRYAEPSRGYELVFAFRTIEHAVNAYTKLKTQFPKYLGREP